MPRRPSLFLTTLLCVLTLRQASRAQETEELAIETLSGAQIYTLFCARCHAPDGTGNVDPEMIAGMGVPPPDFTDAYFSSSEKRSDWKAVIAHGGAARGLSLAMPAWGHVLSERQIEELVEYIKGLVEQERYPQGELNFIRGHYTTKAFVEQEALVIPTYQTKRASTGTSTKTEITAYYANRFGERFQYEVKLPFHHNVAGTTRTAGVGDLEVGLKYAFYDNHRSMTILSAAIEAAAPTGDVQKGFGTGAVVITPMIAAGQGVGNVLQLSASMKLETPLRTQSTPELRLSLLSLLTLQESKQGLFPGLELSMTKNLSTSERTISLVPQVYWGITARGHVAISVGTDLTIGGDRTFDRRIVAFLLWDYVDGGLWW